MEKKQNASHEESGLRSFLTGDRFKAALPLIGFVIIILVMHIMTTLGFLPFLSRKDTTSLTASGILLRCLPVTRSVSSIMR